MKLFSKNNIDFPTYIFKGIPNFKAYKDSFIILPLLDVFFWEI